MVVDADGMVVDGMVVGVSDKVEENSESAA